LFQAADRKADALRIQNRFFSPMGRTAASVRGEKKHAPDGEIVGKVLLCVLEAGLKLRLQRGIFHVVYEKLGARTELRRLPSGNHRCRTMLHAGTRRDACRKHGDRCDPHRAAFCPLRVCDLKRVGREFPDLLGLHLDLLGSLLGVCAM
jgi:hypothetical protein